LDLDQGDIDLDTVTAAKLANVTATGDNNLVFGTTGASTAALASFDASAMTGTVDMGQGVDFTSGADVKTGTGNDTMRIDILTESGVAVAMGEKASDSDTLLLFGANNMGLSVIDLSASDQITQINGATNGAAQSGIENVNLAGLSGSFGASITGNGEANTITGTANADNIVAGGAADVIKNSAGNDTIDLAESTAKIDRVEIAEGTAGVKTITGFGTTDVIDLNVGLKKISDGAALDYGDYSGTKDVPAGAFYTVINLDLANGANTGYTAASDVVLHIPAGKGTTAGTATAFRTAFAANLKVTVNDKGEALVITYTGTGTDADANIYLVDYEGAAGGKKTIEAGDTVTHLLTLSGVGADTLAAGNFI